MNKMSLIKKCFENLSNRMIHDGLMVFEKVCKSCSLHLQKEKIENTNKADKVFKYFYVPSFPEKEVIVSTAPYSKV